MLEQLANSAAAVLNRNLQASLSARRAAAGVEGLCMDVGLSGGPPVMRMTVLEGVLIIAKPAEAPADVSLAGSVGRLVALLGGDHTGPGLDMRGDPAVAEGFGKLLKHCRPDPEEELARVTGDAVAQQAGDAARATMGWATGAAESVRRSARDFVQEEARLAPTRVEFDAFAEQLEGMRDTVGRLAARWQALEARRKA